MGARWLVCIPLLGCGRVAFDARDDASGVSDAGDAAGSDADVLDATLQGDPILHLTFDQGEFMTEPNGHTPACVSACPTEVAGKIGNAASFTSTECLRIADAPELRPAAFTFAVWGRYSMSQLGNLVGRPYQGATAYTNTFEIYIDLDATWRVAVNQMFVTSPVPFDEWHHIALVFDGTTLAHYLDGVVTGTLVIGPAQYDSSELLVGCDLNEGAYGDHLSGLLDDLRFYDRPLAQSEIAALAAM